MKEVNLQIRIPEELKEELQIYCKDNGMSMSEAVRMFIRYGLKDFK